MMRRAAGLAVLGLLALAHAAGAGIISVPAGGNLQQALNQAQPGDTILLAAGATYTGNFVLPAKNGTGYITIRSSAPDSALPAAGQRITPSYASQLPKLRSPAGAGGTPPLATAPYASYYIIQFVEFLPNPSGTGSLLALGSAESSQNNLAVVPHDLIVDRCYFHSYPNVPQVRAIALNSGKTTIQNSYISEMKYAGLDSQAIGGWNGPGPYTIVNNYLQAAGENFMLGGSTMFIPNTTPTKIQFRNNFVTKDPAWRNQSWTVKNLFELKHAQDIVVDGNVFEYNWKAAQPGYAIVITPRNQYRDNPWSVVQRLAFTNNLVRHVSSAVNLLGWDDESSNNNIQTNNITFRNNVFEDVSGSNWGGDGRALLVSETTRVTFDHNTFFNTGSAIYAYNTASDNFIWTNNIANTSVYGIIGDSAGTGNSAIGRYFPDGSIQSNVFVACPSAGTYPAGNFYPSSYSGVGFVNQGGGNYRLASSSPYKGKATDGTDPGANIDALNAALASSSAPPPTTPPTTPPTPDPEPPGTVEPPPPPPTGSLAAPWVGSNIGSATPAGGASSSNGTFTVAGGGADIWGTADSFYYVYQPLSGDGEIVARIASLQNTHAYAKAGVMIREALTAGSRHVTLGVKPGGGVEFLVRTANGGTTTCTGSAGNAPVWVKLVRAGSTITGYSSTNGSTWTKAGSTTLSMGSSVYQGLIVTSHSTSTLNTASFGNVSVTAGAATPPPSTSVGSLTSTDVGAVTIAGSASLSNSTYTVRGSGADIWGTADGFHFAHKTHAGDGQVVARVASMQNTHSYAKAGVMIRETLQAGARHVLLNVRPGGGLELVARSATGSSTTLVASASGSAPIWLKLVRTGGTIAGYSSSNGSTWTLVRSIDVSMPSSVSMGLVVSSHNTGTLNTATFDNPTIGAASTTPSTPPPAAPAEALPYSSTDVGAVAVAGSTAFANGVYTVKGSGANIWGTADAFHYATLTRSGNVQVVARVASMQNTNSEAKAGIMIRESLAAGSKHVVLSVKPSGGVEFMTRTAAGGTTAYVSGTTERAPMWLKLVRSGTTITGYTSTDGTNWFAVGNVTVSMTTSVQAGLVVCSKSTALNTSTFDGWTVQ